MVKYRGRGFLMFLEPFCKISCRFTNILFSTPMLTAFESIYDSTFISAIKRARIRSQNPNISKAKRTKQTGQHANKNLYMVVPYHQGLSERIKRSCNKFWVQVFFKGGQTIKNLLMAPKDKDPLKNKSGVIYRFKCSQHGCTE